MTEVEFFPRDEDGEITEEALWEIREGKLKQESDETLNLLLTEDIQPQGGQPASGPGGTSPYLERYPLHIALSAAYERPGTEFSATVRDVDAVTHQIKILNQMGMDCYKITRNEEDLNGETLYTFNIITTKDTKWRDKKDNIDNLTDEEYLDLFGYPSSELEAYKEENMLEADDLFHPYEEEFIDLVLVDRPENVAERYGRDEEVDKLSMLLSYEIANNPESLESAIERAESRYETLQNLEEEYGVPLTDLVHD